MKSELFERNFDFKEYARSRVLEMDNLDDRRVLKELLNEVLEPSVKYLEDAYISLERRIFGEMNTSRVIPMYVGICKQSEYDITDEHLFPISADDLVRKKHEIETIRAAIESNGYYPYETVFARADYLRCSKIDDDKKTYTGVLQTELGDVTVTFKLKRDQMYQHEVSKLFDIFSLNYLEWSSICAPYLNKMFQIQIIKIDTDRRGQVTGKTLNYEENQDIIREDYIPLWNITRQSIKTSSYPEPCVDRINHDHRIVSSKLDENSRYLVCNTDIYIGNIRRLEGDLIITTETDEPIEFDLLRITNRNKCYFEEVIFGNEKDENFISKYKVSAIKTKAELSRIIESFHYNRYLNFKDCEITTQLNEVIQSYNVDNFIKDEIRLDKYKPYLLLDFTLVKDSYCVRDLMSFLVSNVQKFFPEYICIGKLNESSKELK